MDYMKNRGRLRKGTESSFESINSTAENHNFPHSISARSSFLDLQTISRSSSSSLINSTEDRENFTLSGSPSMNRTKSMRIGKFDVKRKQSQMQLKNSPSIESMDIVTSLSSVSETPEIIQMVQLKLISVMRVYSNEDHFYTSVENKLLDELMELAFNCKTIEWTNEQKEQMKKHSSETNKKFVWSIYKKISQPADNSELESNSPLYYVEFLQTVTQELMKSYSKTKTYLNIVARSLNMNIRSMNNVGNTHNNLAQIHSAAGNNILTNGHNYNEIKEVLLRLNVDCSRQSIVWLHTFIDKGGLKVLFTLLEAINRKSEKKAKHYEVEAETLKVMKIIVNNNKGIQDLLSNPSSLNTLIMSIDSPNVIARTNVIDFLLAVVTISYPKGHNLVLEAFLYFQKTRQEDFIFQGFIKSLKEVILQRGTFGSKVGSKRDSNVDLFAATNGTEKRKGEILENGIKEYMISAISLVRYLIEVPEELEYRIYLRNKMICSGITEILKILKTWAPEEFDSIETNLKAIEEDSREDHLQFTDKISEIYNEKGIDIFEPSSILNCILECFDNKFNQETGTKLSNLESSFLNKNDLSGRNELCTNLIISILQNLLGFARFTDGNVRMNYFFLLEKLVSQIAFDHKGIVPDFKDSFKVSVETVINALISQETFDEKLKEMEFLKEKCETLEFENFDLSKSGEFTFTATETLEVEKENYEVLKNEIEEIKNKQDKALMEHQSELSSLLEYLLKSGENQPKILTNLSRDDSAIDEKTSGLENLDSANGEKITVDVPNRDSSGDEKVKVLPPGPPLIIMHPTLSTGGPPPPPPPPGIPAPPPPPGMGCPPPPPPGMPVGLPKRQQIYFPTVEVKKLQLEKIPDNILMKSVWSKNLKTTTHTATSAEDTKNVDIECVVKEMGVFDDIEKKFAAKTFKNINKNNYSKIEKSNDTVGEITLIDGKRAQNIMIMLGILKSYSLEDLKDAVINSDETVLTEAIVKQCLAYAPTLEDETIFSNFKGDIKKLRKSEQFLLEMLKIDRYEERLKSIQFKITCKERFKSLESDISIVLKAFKALQNSEQFPKLLELVLTLGNYLNSGRFNGKLHGFKISSLNKLVDMKSTDNKFSLLYFLVGVIETKFPEVKNFVVELQDVIAASKVPFQTLKEDMTDLSVNLKLLEKEIEYRKNLDLTEEKKDSFLQKYEDFYEKVKLQFKNLNKNFNLMEKNFLNVIVFFGEDDNISKVKPDEFLNLFKTFLDSYQNTLCAFNKDKELEILTEKKLKAQQERELKKKEREMASLRFPTEEGEEMKGVMDNLLDSLKKGSVSLNHGKGGGQRRIPRSHFRQENSETSVIDRSLGRKTSIGQLAKELLGKLQSDQVEIKESLDTLA